MTTNAIFEPEQAIDPIALFQHWYDQAVQSEPNDPNAMALATATPEGHPSVRMVLMKRLDERGFSFYTNDESQKGRELLANPHAALCFHWKSSRRQVRVEGSVHELSPEDADIYFHSRSRESQIGALVSQQSRPLASREQLVRLVQQRSEEFKEEIPRPAYWRGFVLAPERIEFWENGAFRLHNRMLFTHTVNGWAKTRLFP